MDVQKMENIILANRRLADEKRNNRQIEFITDQYKNDNIIIHTMRGLGDSINQRAFVKALDCKVFLDTPWPEIYEDLPNVTFVRCNTSLRTQSKNIERQSTNRFVDEPPENCVHLNIMYGTRDLQNGGSMYKKMAYQFGVKPTVFDLPDFKKHCPIIGGIVKDITKEIKLAVIRPATIRKEWSAIARNPDPKYLYEAAEILLENNYCVVSICDLEPDLEWIIGKEPPASLRYHKGELNIKELIGLVQSADVLVGGHGWLTHAAVSGKKPMLVIAGGYGGDNSPEQVADSFFTDTSMLTWLLPDNYCKCSDMKHECNKEISNSRRKILNWTVENGL